ncbi:MAG: ParA family protein [Exilibacterium sp.]
MRRVVFNQKGGVGKSSIACNLAAISADRGFRTLVIDLDVQGNSSLYFGVNIHDPGLEYPEATVAHLLRQSSTSWFLNAKPALNFVRETAFKGLDLLAASPLLDQLSGELESRYKIYKLREALEELESHYERIYIDTPPNFNFYSKTALIASDRVLIPFDCDSFSKHALNNLLQNLIDLKQDHNRKLSIEGVVINQFNHQAKLPKTLIKELEQDDLPILKTYLSSSVKMKESHHTCRPLIYHERRHKLTKQFIALFEEIEEIEEREEHEENEIANKLPA